MTGVRTDLKHAREIQESIRQKEGRAAGLRADVARQAGGLATPEQQQQLEELSAGIADLKGEAATDFNRMQAALAQKLGEAPVCTAQCGGCKRPLGARQPGQPMAMGAGSATAVLCASRRI